MKPGSDVDRSRTEGDALPSSVDFEIRRSPLIPRRRLLGNPSSVLPKLSPDGRRLAWQAPVDGVMNIWLAPADDLNQTAPLPPRGFLLTRLSDAGPRRAPSVCKGRHPKPFSQAHIADRIGGR